jgi:hypothetical protein
MNLISNILRGVAAVTCSGRCDAQNDKPRESGQGFNAITFPIISAYGQRSQSSATSGSRFGRSVTAWVFIFLLRHAVNFDGDPPRMAGLR